MDTRVIQETPEHIAQSTIIIQTEQVHSQGEHDPDPSQGGQAVVCHTRIDTPSLSHATGCQSIPRVNQDASQATGSQLITQVSHNPPPSTMLELSFSWE